MVTNVRRRIAVVGVAALIALSVGMWIARRPTHLTVSVENGTGGDLVEVRAGPDGNEAPLGRIEPGRLVRRRLPIGPEPVHISIKLRDYEGFQSGGATFVVPHLRSMRYRITTIRTTNDSKEYRIQAATTTRFDLDRFFQGLKAGRLDNLGTEVVCPAVTVTAGRTASNTKDGGSEKGPAWR